MKPNLLLLHGALGSVAQFGALKKKLAPHFSVFDFNFSGHGGRPVPTSFTIELFAGDTLRIMDHHGLSSAHLFGYSMGGYVALKLAQDRPDRIQKIITLGTKFHWDPVAAAKEVKMMDPEIIEQKIPKFAALLRERHMPEDWKKIMTLTGEMMTGLGSGQAMTSEDYNAIGHQVLVCLGTEDHMVTREESIRVAQQLNYGKFHSLEGDKHPLEGIDIDILSRICMDFLLEK